MIYKGLRYDVKNEVAEYNDSNKGNLYKFLLYKATAVEKNFDCDRSNYTKEIYRKIWGWDSSSEAIFQNIKIGSLSIVMGMDTMNSLWTTLSWALNNWCKKDLRNSFGINRITAKSIEGLIKDYDKLKKIMVTNLSREIFEEFEEFALLTHTIGNFTLIPKTIRPHTKDNQSFNQARALSFNDYFNLSLSWLINNEDDEWTTDTVNSYFDSFFIRDIYVDKDNNIITFSNEQEKILVDNLVVDNRPQSKVELLNLLRNINKAIILRGQKIETTLSEKGINIPKTQQVEKPKGFFSKTIKSEFSKIINNQSNRKRFFFYSFSYLMLYMLIGGIFIESIYASLKNLNKYFSFISKFSIIFVLPLTLAYISASISVIKYEKAMNKDTKTETKILKGSIQTEAKKVIFIYLIIMISLYYGVMFLMTKYEIGLRSLKEILQFTIFASTLTLPLLAKGILNRCRNCQTLNSLKRNGVYLYNERDINKLVETDIIDNDGFRTGKQEQWIIVKLKTYKREFICKRCGQRHYSLFSEEII